MNCKMYLQLYPDALTSSSGGSECETEFTTLEHEEIETESVVEPVSELETEPTANSTITASTPVTVAIRRHHFPTYLPLLILLRYMSTIWMSEIALTSFATPGIHHSAVSYES